MHGKNENVGYLPDEASPDGFVTEVETSSRLLVLRNGDPGLTGFVLHHGVCYRASQVV